MAQLNVRVGKFTERGHDDKFLERTILIDRSKTGEVDLSIVENVVPGIDN